MKSQGFLGKLNPKKNPIGLKNSQDLACDALVKLLTCAKDGKDLATISSASYC